MFEYQCFAGGHFLTYYQCNWFPPSVNSFVRVSLRGLVSVEMSPISYILSSPDSQPGPASFILGASGRSVSHSNTNTNIYQGWILY